MQLINTTNVLTTIAGLSALNCRFNNDFSYKLSKTLGPKKFFKITNLYRNPL